jgi:hypothetical protein
MKWARHVALMEEKGDIHGVLVGKPEGKRPFGRPRRRWKKILKWVFRKWDGGVDWIEVAQNRDRWRALVTAIMNLRVP